jgi:hypothetical protein
MKRRHFIGIDVHCQFCEIAVVNSTGKVVDRDRCATSISALLEFVKTMPRPRDFATPRRRSAWFVGVSPSPVHKKRAATRPVIAPRH